MADKVATTITVLFFINNASPIRVTKLIILSVSIYLFAIFSFPSKYNFSITNANTNCMYN